MSDPKNSTFPMSSIIFPSVAEPVRTLNPLQTKENRRTPFEIMDAMRPADIQPGDRIILAGITSTVRRVQKGRHVLTGEPTWTVYREPDGKAEATFYASDDVTVNR